MVLGQSIKVSVEVTSEGQSFIDHGIQPATPTTVSAASIPGDEPHVAEEPSCSSFLKMARRNFLRTQGLLPALFFTFGLTLTFFPGMVQDTNLRFMEGWKDEESLFILTTLTLYNIWDTVGRSAASWKCSQISTRWVLIGSYLRIIFVPIFFLIAFEVGPSWLFNSDWFKIVNLSIFALTNGWLSSLCAIMAPDAVKQSERGDIGALISPVLLAGITLGCCFAIPLKFVIDASPKGQDSS